MPARENKLSDGREPLTGYEIKVDGCPLDPK
jgi:hypothetical protein